VSDAPFSVGLAPPVPVTPPCPPPSRGGSPAYAALDGGFRGLNVDNAAAFAYAEQGIIGGGGSSRGAQAELRELRERIRVLEGSERRSKKKASEDRALFEEELRMSRKDVAEGGAKFRECIRVLEDTMRRNRKEAVERELVVRVLNEKVARHSAESWALLEEVARKSREDAAESQALCAAAFGRVQELQAAMALAGTDVSCVACMNAPRTTVFLPCKHLACCESCTGILKGGDVFKCPICRQRVKRSVVPLVP
jgi:hypothetical protein